MALYAAAFGTLAVNLAVGAAPAPAAGATAPPLLVPATLAFAAPSSCSGVEFRVCPVNVTVTGSGVVTDDRIEGMYCDGDVSPQPCTSWYSQSTAITLRAAPKPGYGFAGWGGDCAHRGRQLTCPLTVNDVKNVTADFRPVRTVILAVQPPGSGRIDFSAPGVSGSCPPTCSPQFLDGDQVTLTAVPEPQQRFDRWSGGPCHGSTDPVCRFTISRNETITAHFAALRRLTVTVGANGTIRDDSSEPFTCGPSATCSRAYPPGRNVILTAQPAPGYTVARWDGCDSVASHACSVVMNADRQVSVQFALARTLAVTVVGDGNVRFNTPEGPVNCLPNSTCRATYPDGAEVVLTAAGNTGNNFSGWSGDCAGSSGETCTLRMTQNRETSATFTRVTPASRTVTAVVNGNGRITGPGIDCPGDCSEPVADGTSVSLRAIPAPGNVFTTWADDCAPAGTADVCTLVVNGDKTARGSFAPVPPPRHRLSIGVTGPGSVSGGGVSCTGGACAAEYPAGTAITLVATPAPGFNFRGWRGDCEGFDPCTVVLDGDKSVAAAFSPDPVIIDAPEPDIPPADTEPLMVSVSDAGTVTGGPPPRSRFAKAVPADDPGSISCGQTRYACYAEYEDGETVTLRATPARGFRFAGWTGACSGGAATCRVRLTADRRVTARFTPRGAARVLAMAVRRPTVRVRWRTSVGSGRLVVAGRIAGPARLRLALRRPAGGPLLQLRFGVRRAGAFSRVFRVPSRLFVKGARLLPGGFVVSVRGTARGFHVPVHIQTTEIPPPPEGVVRISFASARRNGSPVRAFPATVRTVWVNFRFAAQPRARDLVVRWWFPGGERLLGSIGKANRPVVSSGLVSNAPIPRGAWRADLWAGGRLVKRQFVQIGTR